MIDLQELFSGFAATGTLVTIYRKYRFAESLFVPAVIGPDEMQSKCLRPPFVISLSANLAHRHEAILAPRMAIEEFWRQRLLDSALAAQSHFATKVGYRWSVWLMTRRMTSPRVVVTAP